MYERVTMTNQVSRYAPLFTLAVVVLLTPACYTLLKHPVVRNEDYNDVSGNRCTSCHYEDEIWEYHHPPNRFHPYPGYARSWDMYYYMPWWYESYWSYDHTSPRTVPLPRRGMRPGAFKDPASVGGTTGPPPKQKTSESSLKIKAKDDNANSRKQKSKNRTYRPTKKKKKDG
jgi:hypothetical protein